MLTILVVDDEESCRIAMAMLLEHLGYEVEVVADAEGALAAFDALKHRLVVTDFCMPGMTGDDLAAELKRRSPGTPVLLCSGLPPVRPQSADVLLLKPVSIDDFRKALQALLKSA